MLTIVLRDGRVLQYDDANHVEQRDVEYTLRKKGGEEYFIALIPMDMVERIETVHPCRILKESRDRKKMKKY
jgi:hypothetical protein